MPEESDGQRLLDSVGDTGYGPAAVVLVSIGVIVLAMALVPLVSAPAQGGPPAESLIPVFADRSNVSTGGQTTNVTGAGLGALNVGPRQSVGVDTEDGENPFRSLDTEVHFTIQSEEPAYWRTGSFDSYDGQGWSRDGPSDTSAPATARTVEYTVELAQSSRSPPLVWRPGSVDGPAGISLTAGGRATFDGDALAANTSYTGLSRRPPADTELLASSGRGYPADVLERYTALPNETERALTNITNNVTSDAENPYETATSIETWLEETKEYSLNVSQPEGDVAAEFVHTMSAGYCEYFASAMVAMLRTQNIPARYVVGYSTGQEVDTDTYKVRAMNAHAWVEVYFPDVGWVQFDPTPGDARLERERESFQASNGTGIYSPQEPASPGETASLESDFGTGDSTFGQDPLENITEPPEESRPDDPANPTANASGPERFEPFSLSLNRTSVPGARVEVSYVASPPDFRDSVPVVDARVFLNGTYVGRTDDDGEVVSTLPYAGSVNFSAVGGHITRSSINRSATDPSTVTLSNSNGSRLPGFRQSTRLELQSAGTVELLGTPGANGTVEFAAAVADVPIRQGVIRVNGTVAGRTNRNGSGSVAVPTTPGNATITVDRGPVHAETRVEIQALSLRVNPLADLPIAGTPAAVTATRGGQPAAEVPVTFDGEVVGHTNEEGRYTGTLPFERSVTVGVSSRGQTVSRTLADPLLNFVWVLPLSIGAVLAVVFRRRLFAALGVRRSELTAVSAVWHLASAFRDIVRGERSLDDALVAGTEWTTPDSATSGTATDAGSAGETARLETAAPREAASGATTIGAAWDRLLSVVSVSSVGTKTPAQIAAHAIDSDRLPGEAVRTLAEEFRAVEYGPKSPDDATAAGTAAIEEIEAAVRGDDREGSRRSATTNDAAGDEPAGGAD